MGKSILQDDGSAACQKMGNEKIDAIFTDKVKMFLVCIDSLWFWIIEIFWEKSTYEDFKNLYKFYQFFLCYFFGSKCFNTHKSYTTCKVVENSCNF